MKTLYRAVYKEHDPLGLRKSEIIKEGFASYYMLRDALEIDGYTGMYRIEEYKV